MASSLARVLGEDLGRLAGVLLRDAPRATEARRMVGAMRRALSARQAPRARRRAGSVPRPVLAEDIGRAAQLLADGDTAGAMAALGSILRAVEAPAEDHKPVAEQPPLTLRLRPDSRVEDCPLGTPDVRAIVCVARQIQSDMESGGVETSRRCWRRADPNRPVELSRHDGKRGTLVSRPTCVTTHCPVGARVRLLLGDLPEAAAMARKAPRATDTSEG
jgi:hypothetical protein